MHRYTIENRGVIGDTSPVSSDASMSLVNKTKSHAAYNHGSMLGKRKTEHEFEYPSTPSPAYHHSTVRHPKQFNSAGGEGQVIQELEALTRENAALRREHNRAIRDSEGVSSEMVDDVIDITRSADTETSEVALWEATLQVAKDSFSQVVTPLRIVVGTTSLTATN